jgi:hypothetical protein
MFWFFGPILLLWFLVLFFFGIGILIHLIFGLRHSSQTSPDTLPVHGDIKKVAGFLDRRGLWVMRRRPAGEKLHRPGVAAPRTLLR